jgi:hypothetical protein
MHRLKLFFLLNIVITQITAQRPDSAFISQYIKHQNLKPESDKDSPYARWKRYEAFWSKRLGPAASFELYEKAYHKFYETQQGNNDWLVADLGTSLVSNHTATPPNATFGKWKELGPMQINANGLTLGRTDRIQVDSWDKTGKTIYAMSRSGVFVTNDGGKSWRNFYTDGAFPAQSFTEMVLARDKKTGKKYLYLSVGGDMMRYINQTYADGLSMPFYGIYRIEVGTAKWQNMTGNLVCKDMLGQRLSSVVYKILIDPDNINRVFLGTSEGVFCLSPKAIRTDTTCKSAKTPTWIKTAHTQPVLGLAFDYSDVKRKALYCSGYQLYRSEDALGGQAFQLISSSDTSKWVFNSLTVIPSELRGLQNNRIPGKVFSHLNISSSPAHPTKVFISMGYDYQYMNGTTPIGVPNMAAMVYDKSSTKKFPDNFSILRNNPGYSLHVDKNFIQVSPYQPELVAYVMDFWGSTEVFDVKTNKSISTNRPNHADTHGFDFSPNKQDLVFSNDGGVYKCSVKTSNKMECINGIGLGISTFYGGHVFEGDGKKAMGGFQDNYTHETDNIYSNKGWTVTSMSTGDGDRALFLPNGSVYYNSCYNDGYPYFIRDAVTGNTQSFVKPCRMANVWNKVYKSPSGREEIYITGEDLYFTRAPYAQIPGGCGSSFVQLSEYSAENAKPGACYQTYMGDFDISSDQKTIYAVFNNNTAIWYDKCRQESGGFISCIKTTVGGKNNPVMPEPCTGKDCWTNLPDMNTLKLKGYTTNVAMNPANTSQVWLGSSGYTYMEQPEFNRRVVYSSDGGQTFIDFSEGLPDFSVNRIVAKPGDRTGEYAVYLATDVGVYYRHSDMKKWQRLGAGLPYVIVNDLQLDLKNKKIYAFTFGRGMWVIDIPPVLPVMTQNKY